jgi:probable rRNA maturation factor
MIKVNVFISNNDCKKKIKNVEKYLQSKITKLNRSQKYFKDKKIEFSLRITGASEIKKLNKKFRNKNKVTDILSFPFYDQKSLKKLLKKKDLFYLGDIIINFNKINKKSHKTFPIYSLNSLWVHGLLHLLGHRHKKNKDYKKMLKLETNFLRSINK